MKYMLIHYIDEALLNAWEDEEDEAETDEDRERAAWDEEMVTRGILVGGGVLKSPRSSTTLKVRDGQLLITDGPFAETKEQIAGFAVIECADLATAVEAAARHPAAGYGTIEVRPMLPS
jgi:hypothetical protein